MLLATDGATNMVGSSKGMTVFFKKMVGECCRDQNGEVEKERVEKGRVEKERVEKQRVEKERIYS